jgi:hypothetical protein
MDLVRRLVPLVEIVAVIEGRRQAGAGMGLREPV